MSSQRTLMVAIALVLISGLVACGGSGAAPSPTPTPTPSPTPTPTSTVTITSTAPAAAAEGELYSYNLTASDTAHGTITFAIESGPENAAISDSTLTWQPSHAQARTSNAFKVTATSSAGGSASQEFTVTPTGNINGTVIDHWVSNGSVTNVPRDITAARIHALIPGDDGEVVIDGVGHADGTFSIPGVPAGYYWLKFETDVFPVITLFSNSSIAPGAIIWTNSGDVDLGGTLIGRPDARMGMISESFSLEGSASLPSLSLSWYSPNFGVLNMLPDSDWVIPGGAILSTRYGPLLDSSKQDDAYLLHHEFESQLQKITAMLGPVALQETADGSVTISGTLTPTTPNVTVHPHIRLTAFDQMLNTLPISGTPAVAFGPHNLPPFAISDVPYGGSAGYPTGPVLLGYDPTQDTQDLDFGEVTFAEPFDEHSTLTQFYRSRSRFYPPINGVGILRSLSFSWSSAELPKEDTPLEPVIGPVIAPTIDGKDFYGDQIDIPLTATIAWQPPTLGEANYYVVSVGCHPVSFPPVRIPPFYTRQTSFRIPPGVLAPGCAFSASITALHEPGTDIETSPFKNPAETHSMTISSGLLTTVGTPVASAVRTSVQGEAQYVLIDQRGNAIPVKVKP